MKVDGYSSDELKSFHRILQAVIAEVRALRADFPISELIERLFAAAERGEREPAKLRSAILGDFLSGTHGTANQQRAYAVRPPTPMKLKRSRRGRAWMTQH